MALQKAEFLPGGGLGYRVIASDDCISTQGLFMGSEILLTSSLPSLKQEDRSGAFLGLIRPDMLVWMKGTRHSFFWKHPC